MTKSYKYSEEIREIRKLAKNKIIDILKEPQTTGSILKKIKKFYPDNCNDEFLCRCGKSITVYPEWKHQIRWAIQDLKYQTIIKFDQTSKTYSLIEKS